MTPLLLFSLHWQVSESAVMAGAGYMALQLSTVVSTSSGLPRQQFQQKMLMMKQLRGNTTLKQIFYLNIKYQKDKTDLDIRSILETELRGSSGSVMAWVIHLKFASCYLIIGIVSSAKCGMIYKYDDVLLLLCVPTSYSDTPSCPRQSCSVCLR